MFVDLDNELPSPDPKKIRAGIKYLMSEISDKASVNQFAVFTIVVEWNTPFYAGGALAAVNEYLAKKGWELRILEESQSRAMYKVSPTREFMNSALKDIIT